MCREKSESEVSPALELEDGRLTQTCGGALSLSRRVGILCQLLFPITGVQPSLSSHSHTILRFILNSCACIEVHSLFYRLAIIVTACDQQVVGNTLRYYITVVSRLKFHQAEDKAGYWSAWSCLAVLPIGLAAAGEGSCT